MIVSACSVYIDSAVTSLITERRWALQQTQLVLAYNPHPHFCDTPWQGKAKQPLRFLLQCVHTLQYTRFAFAIPRAKSGRF